MDIERLKKLGGIVEDYNSDQESYDSGNAVYELSQLVETLLDELQNSDYIDYRSNNLETYRDDYQNIRDRYRLGK
jgi:hypothetical protein